MVSSLAGREIGTCTLCGQLLRPVGRNRVASLNISLLRRSINFIAPTRKGNYMGASPQEPVGYSYVTPPLFLTPLTLAAA